VSSLEIINSLEEEREMSFFMFKSVLALFFLMAGIVALFSMLTLMGQAERKPDAKLLRRLHKGAGLVFALLLLVISYLCVKYWASAGDQISTRAVFHSVLAFAVIIVFVLKILIARFYKQFLKFVPVMGLTVFALSFIVFATSAGYYFLRTLCADAEFSEIATPSPPILKGEIDKGAALFSSKCASCHSIDTEESKGAPGLKNILNKKKLPSSQRPATVENILLQLKKPFRVMPAFPSLSEQETADLLAYLKTL
jgi:mono/diheme cytochrome c family protein